MSNLKYAIIEEELVTSTVDSVAKEKQPRPYLVSDASEKAGEFTRRVEAAVAVDFAHGSMPA